MSVVLPIPLGPTIAMRAPLDTVKDTPLKISVGPYDLESELTVMSDMFFHLLDLNAPYYTRKAELPYDFIFRRKYEIISFNFFDTL